MHTRRALRVGVSVALGLVALIALLVAAAALVVHTYPPSSGKWVEFSIGPATGQSASIGLDQIHSDGITVRGAIATAYDIPAVRIVGPPWLSWTRYAITAVAPDKAAFRPLLRQELDRRFHLESHLEPRSVDLFVLTAGKGVRLLEASRPGPATWIEGGTARLRDASGERIAAALQAIIGKPVIDETGLRGSYDLSLDWGGDPVASITPYLRERFGLHLAPATRNVDVLIIDAARRDAAMLLMAQAPWLTRHAPRAMRHHLARLITIR
jgi:uncharacterized protein (TIGR03435 family)